MDPEVHEEQTWTLQTSDAFDYAQGLGLGLAVQDGAVRVCTVAADAAINSAEVRRDPAGAPPVCVTKRPCAAWSPFGSAHASNVPRCKKWPHKASNNVAECLKRPQNSQGACGLLCTLGLSLSGVRETFPESGTFLAQSGRQ